MFHKFFPPYTVWSHRTALTDWSTRTRWVAFVELQYKETRVGIYCHLFTLTIRFMHGITDDTFNNTLVHWNKTICQLLVVTKGTATNTVHETYTAFVNISITSWQWSRNMAETRHNIVWRPVISSTVARHSKSGGQTVCNKRKTQSHVYRFKKKRKNKHRIVKF